MVNVMIACKILIAHLILKVKFAIIGPSSVDVVIILIAIIIYVFQVQKNAQNVS